MCVRQPQSQQTGQPADGFDRRLSVKSADCSFFTFDSTHSSSHIYIALSSASGEVFGGHVAPGCIVRTTAEVLLALLPSWEFSRAPDAATGYDELVCGRAMALMASPDAMQFIAACLSGRLNRNELK